MTLRGFASCTSKARTQSQIKTQCSYTPLWRYEDRHTRSDWNVNNKHCVQYITSEISIKNILYMRRFSLLKGSKNTGTFLSLMTSASYKPERGQRMKKVILPHFYTSTSCTKNISTALWHDTGGSVWCLYSHHTLDYWLNTPRNLSDHEEWA